MEELERIIRERILREGPITFAAFMEEALYHPGLGYYTSPDTEVGRAGDFYTSPHLHPIFGAMLGRQAEEMWGLMGRPGEFHVIESGPGRGWLAKDMLDHLRGRELYARLSYILVELNPHMRERQLGLLREHAAKTRWADSLGDIAGISGLILSNELMDALPVHMVEMRGGLKEVNVSVEGKRFVEILAPPSTPALESYFEEFGISLLEGYRAEVNLRMRGWLSEASSALKEGFVLTIDYGYPARELYAPERSRGTLMCYLRHEVNEDPLSRVGEQDITAHVNFSALKRWGEALGLKALGFARQGPYLVSLGIDEMIAGLMERSSDYEKDVSGIKGLVMPGAMGDTHKVLVQYKGSGSPELRGFSLKNQLSAL